MRRALLCACSDYRDPAFTPLKYPLNDIEEISHLLEEPELCGFEDIDVLSNPGRGEAHEAVEHLTADCSQDDLILFYFSGHGKLAQDGSVALVLNDTKENRLHSTGLLDDQLRALFNASRARQRVIILDCCYSGAVGEEGFKRVTGDAVEAMAQQIKGTFILTASSKFQPAMECSETQGSAFTSCLVEGVRSGAAAEKDTGCVTLSKLGEYLAREVPLRSNQQPKFWDFGGVGGTVIARVPSRFDVAWTEQTLKRLRQMMAREQIDDTLFVEVQQALRRSHGAEAQERLELIDALAQRRLRPLAFLRKWQALPSAEAAEAAVVHSEKATVSAPESERAARPEASGPPQPEPEPPSPAEPEAGPAHSPWDEVTPIQADESPPCQEELPATAPEDLMSPEVPPSARAFLIGDHDQPAPSVEAPPEAPVAKAGVGDFILAGATALAGFMMLVGGGIPVVALAGLVLFIAVWARIWKHVPGSGGRLLLICGTLFGGFVAGSAVESDEGVALVAVAAFLWIFALVLILVAASQRRSA